MYKLAIAIKCVKVPNRQKNDVKSAKYSQKNTQLGEKSFSSLAVVHLQLKGLSHQIFKFFLSSTILN
jgi:hypothetical protein